MTDTNTAELVAQYRAYIAACSGPGTTLYDGHPAVLMSKGIEHLTALERERDEAQSMVQAWDHVFGTIEAHIMDRANMGDPANPDIYLQIIRGDIASIKRASDQICAARWADYERHAKQLTASQAEVERLKEDAERMDWLVSQHVEVRTPMVYGSRANFVAQTLSSEEDAGHRTDLREQIDRSRRAAIQPQVGK